MRVFRGAATQKQVHAFVIASALSRQLSAFRSASSDGDGKAQHRIQGGSSVQRLEYNMQDAWHSCYGISRTVG